MRPQNGAWGVRWREYVPRQMTELVVRQRALLEVEPGGALEGWMDEDAAAAACQLFGTGPAGLLVIDARELLASTARVVGAQLGEIHFKAWMGLITLHVAHGMPLDGRGASTIGEFSRLLWGSDKERGGWNTRTLVRALVELRQAQFTVPGYDLVHQRPAEGVSDTSLLINLFIDETILAAYEQRGEHGLDRAAFGSRLGGKGRGTIAWRMHPDYTQRLAESDLRRFDWHKARAMRGVALALWMFFTSPRVPYRPVFESVEGLEIVEVPLSVEHCHALGVRAATDAARRRTFNQAGARVCAADRSFRAFEAHGGRGRDSFLRVIRSRPGDAPLARPLPPAPGQLTLAA
jgi:hypothetical protein